MSIINFFYPYSFFPCYTGTWTRGSDIPVDLFNSTYFTKIPEYCIVDDKLIIYMSHRHLYVYCIKHDTWTNARIFNNQSPTRKVILMGLDKTAFIGE